MLVTTRGQKIVEKIVTDRTGKMMRVVFLVTEIAGALSVRVLSATPVVALTATTLALAGFVKASVSKIKAFVFKAQQGFADLAFFMSQPTRAPACI